MAGNASVRNGAAAVYRHAYPITRGAFCRAATVAATTHPYAGDGYKTNAATAGAAFTAKTGLGAGLWRPSGAAGADIMAGTGETAGAKMATAGQRRRASRGESQRLAPGNDAATAVDEPA